MDGSGFEKVRREGGEHVGDTEADMIECEGVPVGGER